MKLLLPKSSFLTFIFLIANLFFANVSFGQTITLDQADLDYAPGETVYITGTGWYPNEIINLQVDHLTQPIPDHGTPDPHLPWTVVADSSGNFSASWFVTDYELGANLLLNADGLLSGYTYEVFFADAPTISSVSPNTGQTIGGTSVTINGAGFVSNGTITVSFGGIGATNVVRGSNNQLTCTTPAHVSGSVTVSVTVTGSGGGNNGTGSLNNGFTYNKVSQTITFNNPGTKIYGDVDFNLAATASSGLTVSYSIISGPATIVSGNMLHITGAGTVTVRASQAGDGTYAVAGNVDQTFDVNKATPTATLAVNNSPVTYTGSGQSATVGISASSVPGTVSDILTGGSATQTATGTYAVTASFVPTDSANYNTLTGLSAGNFVINKAESTIAATGTNSFTYNGSVQGPTSSTVTGSTGAVTYSYSGVAPTVYSASATRPTNAGTYQVIATVASDVNYNGAISAPLAFTIGKASSTTTVTIVGGPFTYSGSVQNPATVSVTGVGGLSLTPTADYANNTNAGTATASYTYAGDANHETSSDSKTFVINKADAVVTVNGYTGIYDAAAHGATGSAVGVAGDLSATGSTLNLGSSFTNVPGGTANWTFTGGTNYNDQSGSVDITINKAAANIVVNGYTGTYDATAHGASLGSATGVAGADLSSSVTIAPTTYTNYPGGAVGWSFANNNYAPQSGSVDITINKADAIVTVNGYTGIYDAAAHGATGSAVGVAGDLSATGSTLNLGSSFTNVPGGTANWTFTGGTNYNDQSGSVDITINKAAANIVVNGYTGTYDATAHGASLISATGVASADLSSSVTIASTTYTNYPGGTVGWSFANNNYAPQSGSVDITINKADAVVTVNGYTGIYDAAAHGATGSAVGVTGDLSATGSTLNLGSSFTNVPGGTANWTFTGGTNYNDQSGSVTIAISKANTTVSVTGGGTFNFDNIAHAVTAYAVGVEGDHITSPFTFNYVGTNCAGAYNSATAPSAPGTYTATAIFGGNSNYNGSSSTAIIIINSTLSATIATNKPNLYFGFSGGDTATITVKPIGGKAPYKVSITMVNPQTVLPGRIKERVDGKLICDYINASGDEVWIPGANTNSTTGNSCDNQPTSTSNANISMGGSYSVSATLLTDARFVATVTDANVCSYTIPVESAARVDAEDARCFAGKSGVEKVTLCHKTGSVKNPCMEICVDQSAVQEHLNHGDFLGKCTNNCLPPVANAKHLGTGKTLIEDTADEIVEFNVIAYPNPSNYQFSLAVTSGSNEKVEVLVYNMSARLIKRIEKSNEKTILFGEDLPAGEYLVLVRQGENQKAVNVIKK